MLDCYSTKLYNVNFDDIWRKVVQNLENELPVPALEMWIKTLEPISFEENTLKLVTNRALNKEYVVKNYSLQIMRHLKELLSEEACFEIVVDKTFKKEVKQEVQKLSESTPEDFQTHIPLKESQVEVLKVASSLNLNLKYNFENFVVGENSKFAHGVALEVAKKPGERFNPLFIYGSTGLGKTHLMHAIGHYILLNHHDLKVKCISAETFANEFIKTVNLYKGNEVKKSEFRQKYRNVDVLLIDDIQFLDGKTQTQSEFFHTFEYLYNHNKQIIMTSEYHPKNIATLSDRLRSRFESGILAELKSPSLETRVKILKHKASLEDIELPDDVANLLASAYQSNVRELEGALNRVAAYASIKGEEITLDWVKDLINYSGREKNLTVNTIIDYTASAFNIEPAEIKGQSRSKEISYARQVAIYLARELKNESFPKIGESFGNRKHTSIMYSYEKVKEEIEFDKNLQKEVDGIIKRINEDFIV